MTIAGSAADSEDVSASPLMMFVLAALTSMMTPTLSDGGLANAALARLAAREAIDAYRMRGQGELLTIGQIVGFAVAALDTLRLSMPAEVSVSMKLRLRGNASALNQSSCRCTKLLENGRVCGQVGGKDVRPRAERTGATFGGAGSAQGLRNAGTPNERALTGIDWATAMQSVAVTLQTEAVSVSAEQREIDAMWIEALNGVGAELIEGSRRLNGPGGMRSRLMASLEPGFPPHLFDKRTRKRG